MVTPLAVFLNVGLLNEMAPVIVKASVDADADADADAVRDEATVVPSTLNFFSLVEDDEYRLCRLAP